MNVNRLNKTLELSYALYDPKSDKRCSHFAFAYYKGKLIAVGENNKKTHPINLRNPKINRFGTNVSYQKGTCAELNCLKKIKNSSNIPFENIELVVVRIDRNKEINLSRPCCSCSSLCSFLGVKNVYYTSKNKEFVQL